MRQGQSPGHVLLLVVVVVHGRRGHERLGAKLYVQGRGALLHRVLHFYDLLACRAGAHSVEIRPDLCHRDMVLHAHRCWPQAGSATDSFVQRLEKWLVVPHRLIGLRRLLDCSAANPSDNLCHCGQAGAGQGKQSGRDRGQGLWLLPHMLPVSRRVRFYECLHGGLHALEGLLCRRQGGQLQARWEHDRRWRPQRNHLGLHHRWRWDRGRGRCVCHPPHDHEHRPIQ
mmetsp:Transcript_76324/g.220544  ORF Transcript_76324/g.220544 Transcript_76324/m.220544 type:complete len:227 (+) Transcript_76324:1177-1857(+)